MWKRVLLFFLLIVVAGYGYYTLNPSNFFALPNLNVVSQNFDHLVGKAAGVPQTPTPDTSKQISLQQVSNTGYIFYLGQLDTPNAPAISDDVKNKITELLYSDRFPKSLLKTTAIIIVNTLAVTAGQYVATPSGNLAVQDFSPEFLTGGGEYATYTNGQKIFPFSLIFINKTVFDSGQLAETLSHELGHHLASTLTVSDWTKFYQLRRIPSGTPQEVSSWAASPAEDFAEVYKNVVTGIAIKTIYGFLEPAFNSIDIALTCGAVYLKVSDEYVQQASVANTCGSNSPNYPMCLYLNTLTADQISQTQAKADASAEVQSCRRKVLENPSQYPDDYQYGTPYHGTVGPETKAFINLIVSRLN